MLCHCTAWQCLLQRSDNKLRPHLTWPHTTDWFTVRSLQHGLYDQCTQHRKCKAQSFLTQLPHFGPLTTGRQWVLQGLTHTHPNCLKTHRQPLHTQAHMHTATRTSTSAWCWGHLTSWVRPPSLRVWNAMVWANGGVGTAWSPWTCTNQ